MPSPKAAPVKMMRHTQVLAGIQTARDAGDPYREGLWSVVLSSSQVKAFQLPKLSGSAAWPGGATAHEQTRITWTGIVDALQAFTHSTLQNVIDIPEQMVDTTASSIVPSLNAAIHLAQALMQNPANDAAHNGLMTQLHMLNIFFNQHASQMTALIESLQSQSGIFDTSATTMNTFASQALQNAGNEKQLVQSLIQQIATLNADITAATVALAEGSLATVANINLGVLGIVLAPATPGVNLSLMVPATLITAESVSNLTFDSIKIEQDKSAIGALNAQISQISGDIVLVNTMASTLTSFSNQVDSMRNALTDMAAPWEAAETYITDTIGAIDSQENIGAAEWQQVNTELNEVLNSWNSLMVSMNQLDTDAQVAPHSTLHLGMSQSKVQQAMNASPRVPLIDFLTQAA